MASQIPDDEAVTIEYRGKIAIITLNLPKKLNALSHALYFRIACLLHEIAARDDIFITLLAAKGRFFSAGADISRISYPSENEPEQTRRLHYLQGFTTMNLHTTHAFYSHPKILITALNGPAVGMTATLTAFSDFVYCTPEAYILTPFTSLGLISEGNAARAFVERMGISKANEALIMSKKITAEELLHCGFVNKIFDTNKDTDKFNEQVLAEVNDRLGENLNADSMLKIKKLIRKPGLDEHDRLAVHEVLGGMERHLEGIPQKEFAALASGKKRHKL
ncbi:d3,d2-enoyl-CoA isomerase-like protein [Pseudovirgaria hyperparasitica]|uniref:D3,d2-enoyl-CoA isomerase-like protein n=1 Tax=Pseudovirgaria hyperparasitica TaxID=470096 RepID=A0A6A6VZ70_9PEZI|nr:d3,d2-enoyl-CoA isomerase-like protein [Pseudovirgaria hyperparasitica]KAF2755593.1 d3,d2-enoyl-CoA isomerase-like protein [Pseudovirgaria hyperparasitica]